MRATYAVSFMLAVMSADGLRCTSRRSALGLGTALLMPRQRALADMQGTPFGPCERTRPAPAPLPLEPFASPRSASRSTVRPPTARRLLPTLHLSRPGSSLTPAPLPRDPVLHRR